MTDMEFDSGQIYHIYNQGNNRQAIFFSRENYRFFLGKIETHVFPYVEILAWCLMPNHFHLMVVVNEVELFLPVTGPVSGSATVSRAPTNRKIDLNHSIGIMLASYTRAINIQEGRSGSLFRQKTKAECLSGTDKVSLSFINTHAGTLIDHAYSDLHYPQICFDYIHNNPVAAGLVSQMTDWEFSSARDYAGLRDGGLVNKKVAGRYLDISWGRDNIERGGENI